MIVAAMANRNDPLLERAQAAMDESRRLQRARHRIFEHMMDIAVTRLIVAREMERRLRETELELVAASTEALRIAKL